MDSIFTSISIETVTAARERVLNDLQALTNNDAVKAIALVRQYKELDGIIKEHEERQKYLEEKATDN